MDATAYLLAGSPEAERAVAENAAKQIELGTTKLLEIVLSLKQYVDGDDLIQEAKAIEYLSSILELLHPSVLSRQDVSLLCRYLEVRIGIGHTAGLKESAIGLKALAAMDHFDPKEAKEICEKITSMSNSFNEYPVAVRIEVYKLIDLLMEKYRDALRLDSSTIIPGLLSLAEMEKDPRNLMLYFSILFVILSEWNIDDHAENLWEAVSKYFPITFRPRPNDPIGITANDLKLRLRQCIAATGDFAPWSFLFLIQKLDHQVNANVKKDVMQTMTACVTSYGIHPVSTWSGQIWNALKYEIISATEDGLAEEALGTLRAITTCLSAEGLTLQTLSDTMLFNFVDLVCKECIKHFQNKTHVKQSGQILGKIASGSPFSFHLVVKDIFPRLLTIVEDTAAVAETKDLLEAFNQVLDARLELVQAQEISRFPSLAILDAVSESCEPDSVAYGGLTFFRDTLFEMFSVNLVSWPAQEIALRSAAMKGLLKLIQIPHFLAPNEIGMIIQHFNKLIIDFDYDELRMLAIDSLQEVAQLYPQQVGDITFPALLAKFPDVAMEDRDVLELTPILEAFASISMHNYLFPIFVRRLLNKMEEVFRKGLVVHQTQSYACAILASILYCLRQREIKYRENTDGATQLHDSVGSRDVEHYRYLVQYLCTFFTTSATRSNEQGGEQCYIKLRPLGPTGNPILVNEFFLELVGNICMTAVRSMNITDQQWAANGIFALFASLPQTVSGAEITETQIDICNAKEDQVHTLILSYSLLAGLRREVSLGFDPHVICCKILQHFYNTETHELAAFWPLSVLLALLVNKWDVNLDVKAPHFLKTVGDLSIKEILAEQMGLKKIADPDSLSDIAANEVMQMAVLLVNAINFRGDRATKDLLHMLVEELKSPWAGTALARQFKFPYLPSDLFCKENYVVIRGLYRQRPFAICFPRILEHYKMCSDQNIKRDYLVALSGILENTPSEVILPEIDQLMPIILQSMETLDLRAKAASIEVLQTAILQSPSSVEGHIRSVIKRLLNMIHNPSQNPADAEAKVREMALKCLAVIPSHVKEMAAFPFKFEVLRKLENASKDIKRSVRVAAVQCRYTWFSLTLAVQDED